MKVGFLGLLALILIILKLLGHISWSWWLVTAPLWGGFVVGILFWLLALVGICALIRR